MTAKLIPVAVATLLMLALVGCGFHPRRSVALPTGFEQVHVEVAGGGDLRRQLVRALQTAGAESAPSSGPGIVDLQIPVASFNTDALSIGGRARVREYSVHYHVEFRVLDASGELLLETQSIDMSRAFTYDAAQALGTATREEEVRRSLVEDMTRAILRRLQAASAS